MNRSIVYIGQIPMDTDILNTNLNAYIGLAKLSAGVLGTTTQINAFTCVPTSPASMNVLVTPGEIYELAAVDTAAYGSLAPNSLQILKQGLLLANTAPLPCPAPVTVGNSINYLIQITLGEVDGGSQVLPYYDSANPSQAFSGPNNDGLPNYTTRYDNAVVAVKAGTSAPTGTQTTPSPDTGYVAAFVVTVAYGATSITSGNISISPSAPFITNIPTMISTLATKVGIQNSSYIYAADTGSANAYAIAPSPAYTAYADAQVFKMKASNTSTGACTLNVNGLGVKNIKLVDGIDPYPGAIKSGGEYDFRYDGTNVQLLNPTISAAFQYGGYGYAADSGSANALVVTYTPALTSYSTNTNFYVKVAATNTSTTCTINANSLGTKSIKLVDGSNPYVGAMVAGGIYNFRYDGTNVLLLNPTPSVAAQNNPYTYFVDSGSANAYAITPVPAVASLVAGQSFKIKIANANVGASVTSVTVSAGGSFAGVPGLFFTSNGVGSGATASARMGVLTASVSAAGSGYNVGDTITLTGGSFTQAAILTVATLTGGAGTGVATFTITNAGVYSSFSANPVSQGSTSGSGTGATFNLLTFKIVSVVVTSGGSGYTNSVVVAPVPNSGATLVANTGYSNTLNVGTGATNIVLPNGSAPAPGQIGTGINNFSYDGTNFVIEKPASIPDIVTVITSTGVGNYITPLAALSLYVEMVGGGAGGQGNSSNGNVGTAATSGGDTTFGSLTANGGSRGSASTNWNSGAGGGASGGDINITGGAGAPGLQNSAANAGQLPGGMGGASYYGGAGAGGNIGAAAGGAAGTNSGSGGGGAGVVNTNSYVTGAGGGAGGFCAKLITPTALQQFSYAVGTAGSAGTGGTANGGAGAAGIIVVRARFQ